MRHVCFLSVSCVFKYFGHFIEFVPFRDSPECVIVAECTTQFQ